MECNCNNNNSNVGVIPWVRGNRLPLIICVYENVVTQEQVGDSTLTVNEMTRVPYEIQDNDTVTVTMKSGFRQVEMPFTTDGNKVMVTDNGELPTGAYTVEVTIERGDGARGRWQETRQVRIYENTSDAQLGEMYSVDADLFFYAKGDTGTGIADITNNPDGTLTITMTDGTSYTTEALKGDKGDKGDTGERGVSIVAFDVTGQTDVSVIYTVTFSDDTTQDISVPKGPQGDTGLTGNGISTTTLNSDYTLTIAYTDGSTYTTPSIRGAQGAQGVSVIGFTQTGETATNTMYNLVFSDGRTQSVAIPKGVKGDKGDTGNPGPQGAQGPKGDTVIIGDEQTYTLYGVTGQNSDGAMTQKAVTDSLVGSAISYDNSESGLAAESVQGAVDEVSDNFKVWQNDSSNVTSGRYIGTGGTSEQDGNWLITYGIALNDLKGTTLHFYAEHKQLHDMLNYALYTGTSLTTYVSGSGYQITSASDVGWKSVSVDELIETYPTAVYIRFTLNVNKQYQPFSTIDMKDVTDDIDDTNSRVDSVEEQTIIKEDAGNYDSLINGFSLQSNTSAYSKSTAWDVLVFNVIEDYKSIEIQSNTGGSLIAFMKSYNTPTATGDSVGVYATGYSYTIIQDASTTKMYDIPEDCNYVLFTKRTSDDTVYPLSIKFGYSIQTAFETLADKVSVPNYYQLVGAGNTWKSVTQILSEGKIYSISLDKNYWDSSSTASGYLLFRIEYNGKWIENQNKGGGQIPMKQLYYVYSTGNNILSVGWRADVGQTMNITVRDVTNEFNKKVQDIFFTDDTTQVSAMCKVEKSQLIRYSLYSNGSVIIKFYSMAKQDDTYLVDSIQLSDTGYHTGEYMPTEDVFMVAHSIKKTGFKPLLRVYEYGINVEDATLPYQFVADTDNIVTLLSSTDQDATAYDNRALNHCKIIQVDDNLWYMWYMGFGSGSLPYICMAVSNDGLNWTRGLPSGTSPVIADTNVILKPANDIVPGLSFHYQCVNEFDVVTVNDINYPFRMVCNIRNATTNVVTGENMWMMKSADGVTWIPMKQITEYPHDTYPRIMNYEDILKIYIRMWDYNVKENDQRYVGVMYCDIKGNVIVPQSGLFGYGLYNSGAVRISNFRDLLIPTHYYPTTQMDALESYIVENDNNIKYCPAYGLENLKFQSDNDGWGWVSGVIGIGTKQYIIYEQATTKHSSTTTQSDLRACPIKWITYKSYNGGTNPA